MDPEIAAKATSAFKPPFKIANRFIRMELAIPTLEDFTTQSRLEQEERRRWRALLLVIRAKIKSVESGVETFDEAWLPHIVVPGGGTVGQRLLPDLAKSYSTGKPLPPLLGAGS